MTKDARISWISAWDKDMKSKLRDFCEKVGNYWMYNNSAFDLYLGMSWWENNAPWLPLVRKDRAKMYRENSERSRELAVEIERLYRDISDRLKEFIGQSKDAVMKAEADDRRIFAAQKVLAAFESFFVEITGYNWFLRSRDGMKPFYFVARYPDAETIYSNALEEFEARGFAGIK